MVSFPQRWARSLVLGLTLLNGGANVGSARAEPAAADPEIVKLVPADIRAAGVLRVGTDATYAPFESMDPKTHEIVGFDADLGRAIAASMGLKAEMVNTPFDSLIPSLASGKLNLAMSSIGDTKEREGVVDFVTYYWNSTNLLVPAANPKKLATDTLCGAKVGVERGSLQQVTFLPALTVQCSAEDRTLATGSVFKANTDAVLAMQSGRIDAVLNDAVANDAAAANSAGQMKAVGPLLRNKSPGGVAIRKASGLQQAVLAAVKKVMADGTYAAALKTWNLEAIGIDAPTLNWADQQK